MSWFLHIDLVFCEPEKLAYSSNFLVDFGGISTVSSSAKRNSFVSPFPICTLSISSPGLMALARPPSVVLKSCRGSRHPSFS